MTIHRHMHRMKISKVIASEAKQSRRFGIGVVGIRAGLFRFARNDI
jgi:hypothetical protein